MTNIQILTDGKIGDLVQCRGVASRLQHIVGTDGQLRETVVSPTGFWSLPVPFMPIPPGDRATVQTALNADLVLASGRRTLPYLRTIRRQRTGRLPLIVFLKNPRWGRGAADFVWAPVHDQLTGDDVISTDTSPHSLTDDALQAAKIAAQERFAAMQPPFTGIILGGNSGSVKWDGNAAGQLSTAMTGLLDRTGGTALVTPSRRTPPVLMASVREALSGRPCWIWDGKDDNPYAQILTHSDQLLVTGDSHNMVSEALASGHPVRVCRPPGLQKKLHAFLNAMEARGAIREAEDQEPFEPVKIDATGEIAAAIAERLKTFKPG